MSKFNTLRSIFEPNEPKKNLELIQNEDIVGRFHKRFESTKTSGRIMSRKPDDLKAENKTLSGLNPTKIASNSDKLSRHDSVKLASNSRVVSQPHPGKNSPKSDIKNSSRSKKKEISGRKKRKEEQVQLSSIDRFLIRKEKLPCNQIIEGESKPPNEALKDF